jgi:uncharacterized protein (TIGR02145 family)
MKKVFKISGLAFSVAIMAMLACCKKNDSEIPALSTLPVSVLSATAAETGGIVTSGGGGEVTSRGVVWSTSSTPSLYDSKTTDGTGTGEFSSSITGLTSNITYYVRAYAMSSTGTSYGDVLSFTTPGISGIHFNPDLNYGSVSDIDGNLYKTIQIGSQVWLAENLKTTKYNDGAPIPDVTDQIEWQNRRSDAYCWYNNAASSFKAVYGALYNWYAVNTAKLCPSGWHVPTLDEWKILAAYLGGEAVAGGKLKETGTGRWLSPNAGATNSSGFAAVPAGLRDKSYFWINVMSKWWSSDQDTTNMNFGVDNYFPDPIYNSLILRENGSDFYIGSSLLSTGQSVRCVMDN